MKDKIHFNGIHGRTGQYFTSPHNVADAAQLAREFQLLPAERRDTKAIVASKRRGVYAPLAELDVNDLAVVGWGVIFPETRPERPEEDRQLADIRAALKPLLALRAKQAGDRYRCITYRRFQQSDGARGETKDEFLARFKVGRGRVNPAKLPYYLMICASPEQISYEFQYLLDIQFAVGRLYFDDIDSYRAYAESMVEFESRARATEKTAAFFGAVNQSEPVTEVTTRFLVEGLYEYGHDGVTRGQFSGWTCDAYVRERATKAQLLDLLGGTQTPSFLLTGCHGLAYYQGEEEQLGYQGALVCSDWRMVDRTESVGPEHFVCADDLGGERVDDRALQGLITCFFSCFGTGTPVRNQYLPAQRFSRQPVPRKLAQKPFVAKLAQRVLECGGQAVIGHIERVWNRSFFWYDRVAEEPFVQLESFQSLLNCLFAGGRVGHAMSAFNERYAELAADLLDMQRYMEDEFEPDIHWAFALLCCLDARNYIVLGDPAARL